MIKRIINIAVAVVMIASVAWGEFDTRSRLIHYAELNRYVLVVSANQRFFLQLRDFENNQVVDDVVLFSKYIDARYEFRDVVFDDAPELLVQVQLGGTNLSYRDLYIFLIQKDRLVEIGTFRLNLNVTATESYSFPGEDLLATVAIGKDHLTYAYTHDVATNATNFTSVSVKKFYRFDSDELRYVMTNSQKQQHSGEALEARKEVLKNRFPEYAWTERDDCIIYETKSFAGVMIYPGDTLEDIALQWGVSKKRIMELNGIDSESDVSAGMVLRLPARK